LLAECPSIFLTAIKYIPKKSFNQVNLVVNKTIGSAAAAKQTKQFTEAAISHFWIESISPEE
jgi:hypothetical protein